MTTSPAQFFKDKKITLMGLGLLGRGVGDALFLAQCGADVTVTDLKTAEQLASSIEKLNEYDSISYTLGGHDYADFENCDMVIKAAGVPLDSPYAAHAEKNNIPVMMDESLFVDIANNKLGMDLTIIGVTGTRGKSMTTQLIYEIMHDAGMSVHLAGNLRGLATLPLLERVKKNDYVVMELSSWQLQGFDAIQTSPHIAVFTTFMEDHLNYYHSMQRYFDDKAIIFKHQSKDDYLIIQSSMQEKLDTYWQQSIPGNVHTASDTLPSGWEFPVPGSHMQANAMCAVEVARCLDIDDDSIQKSLASFQGLEGRMQKLATINGIEIYNDNNATTPQATIASLHALGGDHNIVLIAGGADKDIEIGELPHLIEKHCRHAYLLEGSGTERLTKEVSDDVYTTVRSLQEAFEKAWSMAQSGEIIVLSPAFASFNMYANEYERNDEFISLVHDLQDRLGK